MADKSTTSLFRLGGLLMVVMQDDMTDQDVLGLQEALGEAIVEKKTSGVVIDVSQVSLIDSFTGRVLSDLAEISRLLDAKTVMAGLQPAVALTLVELGLELPNIRTALNMEAAVQILDDGGRG